jgi:hypothetical protein
MSRLTRSLLAIALLACAPLARADALRLHAPAGGTTLRGGSFADVRWSAAQLPAGTEEWEAFLSVDGGKYYAFRVTPHLDINRRNFTFVVPNVETRNARILIRTGNELRETLFELPATFAIERDANAEQVLPRLLHVGRGEAAREGDPGVVEWAAGSGRQSSPALPAKSFGRRAKTTADAAPIVLTQAAKRATLASLETARPSAHAPHATRNAQPTRSVDLLLVCRRRNV